MTSIISPPSRRCYHSCRRSSLIRRDTAITNLRRKPYHRSKLFSDLACSTSGRETRYRQSVDMVYGRNRRSMSLVKLSALFRPQTRSPGQVFCVTVSTGAASSLKTSTRQRQQQRRQQQQQQQQQRRRRRRRRRRAHLPSADLPVARRKTTPRCIVVTRHHRPQRHRRAPAYRHWRS